MKTMMCLVFGLTLVSFSRAPKQIEIDGIWMGAFGAGEKMQNVVVKFDDQNRIEWYKGEVEENNAVVGNYHVSGDSVILSYTTTEGKQYTLHGFVNLRKNYVDGNWETSDNGRGSFYLKKQKVTEYLTQP